MSRAAVRMNQTQPAISAALRRLREVLGDPILVRAGRGLVPTPKALELRGQVQEIKGRKVVVQATVSANGAICARGQIVAVQMPENMRPS